MCRSSDSRSAGPGAIRRHAPSGKPATAAPPVSMHGFADAHEADGDAGSFAGRGIAQVDAGIHRARRQPEFGFRKVRAAGDAPGRQQRLDGAFQVRGNELPRHQQRNAGIFVSRDLSKGKLEAKFGAFEKPAQIESAQKRFGQTSKFKGEYWDEYRQTNEQNKRQKAVLLAKLKQEAAAKKLIIITEHKVAAQQDPK